MFLSTVGKKEREREWKRKRDGGGAEWKIEGDREKEIKVKIWEKCTKNEWMNGWNTSFLIRKQYLLERNNIS